MGDDSLIVKTSVGDAVARVYNDLFEVPLGGPKDTLALLSIASAGLCAVPSVNSLLSTSISTIFAVNDAVRAVLPAFTAAGLAGVGAAWLTRVFTDGVAERGLLRSAINFKSSPPPMVPGSKPGLFFGITCDEGNPIYVDYETLTRHMLVVGASGVGKTVAVSQAMMQQIERGGGVLFIDPKVDYENLQSIYNFAAWSGRASDFYILAPGDPKNSNTYNPLLYGDPDEVTSRCVGLIPSTESNAGADYYKQAAASAIRAIVGAYQYLDVPYTAGDLALLLDNAKALERLYDRVQAKDPRSDEAIALRLWLENFRRPFDPKSKEGTGSLDMNRLKLLLGGFSGRLQQFSTGTFGKVMNVYDPEVKLHEIIEQGKILYVALPTMGKDQAAITFGKMLINDLRTCVSWLQMHPERRPRVPFMAFIDEAGRVLGDGSAIAVLTEQMLSARIYLTLALQNFAQFKAVDESLAEMVPGNTTTKLIFRLASNDSPNELAELIGMRMKALKSISQTAAKSASAEFAKVGPGHVESNSVNTAYGEREQEDFIISPDMIRRLDKGECIMLLEGDKVYDLRVPMVSFTSEMRKKIGRFRVQHRKPSSRRGLIDLRSEIDQFTTHAPLSFNGNDMPATGAKAAQQRSARRASATNVDRFDPGQE